MNRRDFARAAAAALLFAGAPSRAQGKGKVLIVSTSHAEALNGRKTGLWLSELTEPYWVFRDAGHAVDIASIQGGAPPIDPRSGSERAVAGRLRNDAAAIRAFNDSVCIDCINPGPYVGVFLAGGHGAMWDFPQSASLRAVLEAAARERKPIGAVCHGPAGLLGARLDDRPLVAGRRVTGFTDAEEERAGWTAHIPYSLEQRLKAEGANFVAAGTYQNHVVRDGLLVAGQNPASAEAAARAMLDLLKSA